MAVGALGGAAWNAANAEGNCSGKKPLPAVPAPTDSRSGIIQITITSSISTSLSSTSLAKVSITISLFLSILYSVKSTLVLLTPLFSAVSFSCYKSL